MGEFERYKKGMRGLEKIPGLMLIEEDVFRLIHFLFLTKEVN